MSTCPYCSWESEFIYISPLTVECVNPRCGYYSDTVRNAYEAAQRHPNHQEDPVDDYNPFGDIDSETTDPMWVGVRSLFPDPPD